MKDILFTRRLKALRLSKRNFASLTSLPYQTIMNWNRHDKVPLWVNSWLDNYTKARFYNDMRDKVLNIEGISKDECCKNYLMPLKERK